MNSATEAHFVYKLGGTFWKGLNPQAKLFSMETNTKVTLVHLCPDNRMPYQLLPML